MKFSSKPLTAALILIGAVLLCSTASAIPSKPVPERLVNDFAGLFRPAQKAELEEMLLKTLMLTIQAKQKLLFLLQ